jgi:hypothetical protein
MRTHVHRLTLVAIVAVLTAAVCLGAMRQAQPLAGASTTVTNAAYATLLTYTAPDAERVCFGWEVSDAALADVKIQVQAHGSAAWEDYLDGADLRSGDVNGNVLYASSDAASGCGYEDDGEGGIAAVALHGFYAVRFVAQAASDDAAVICRATFD